MEEELKATFAGGCFWCMQPPFDGIDGVKSTKVGYTGGHKANPTYKEVCEGTTGHVEALQLTYDPSLVSYEKLLELFWHQIDPNQSDGQFCDIGPQYRPVIFYHDDNQKKLALASKERLIKEERLGPIKVSIEPATEFYLAEDYHQKYYKKSRLHYELYKHGSGRNERLKALWGENAD